jgi:hypothetical protein
MQAENIAAPFAPKTPRYMLPYALEVIQALIDSHIADKQDEEVEANLYSARLHITKAIEEAEKRRAA